MDSHIICEGRIS